MVGRKPNNNNSKLKFQVVKVQGRHAAKCNYCNNIVKNTAASRLQAHRNVCTVSVQKPSTSGNAVAISQRNENAEEQGIAEDLAEAENLFQPSLLIAENENIVEGEYSVMNDGVLLLDAEKHIQQVLNNDDNNNNSVASTSSNCSDRTLIGESFSSTPGEIVELVETPVEGEGTPTLSGKKRKRKDIAAYFDQLNDREEQQINKSLSEFMFGCNVPFSLVESRLLKNFIKSLRPAYADKIPGRKKLSTTLLNQCYEDCIQSAKDNLGENSVILCDGWKNSSNNTKTVVTMLHTADGKNAFLDAWDFTTESETGEHLVTVITESRNIAKEKYNVNTYAVVSDNASAMVKMGNLLKHAMWHSTCNSHTGNLLAKDVLDKDLCANVVLIMKEFKQPDLEKDIVKKGGHRIKLPAETRWCTYRDCFKNFLDNLEILKQITAVTKKKIKARVKELIFNDEFVDEVRENLALHDPICNLINVCQKAETSIADAVELWLNLKLPAQFEQQLKHRQEMALNTYALVAYYFHPLYNQKNLTADHKKIIHDFLFRNLDADGLNDWDSFNIKSGIFTNLFEKNLQPLVFWRFAKMECPKLGSLVLKLLNIPASSANIERLFSNWGNIHSLLRNRLTFDKSKKLLHVYFTLHEKSDKEELNLDME